MNYFKRKTTQGQQKNIILPTVMFITLGFINSVQFTNADQQILDDLIVVGSACIGQDCVNGENFNFDSIRLKENNLRIKFQDTSSAGGFPSNDWQLTANDSANGGDNYFAIDDITGARTPFKVSAGAPNNSIFVKNNGFIGFNTNTPAVSLQTTNGNSPTLRLEQDGSQGFGAQSWDVAGNEANFFIRDATNGGRLPFRIQPAAPSNSLYIASDGDIGLETSTPDGILDIAHPADANNHAVLVDSLGNFGINIDNGFTPNGLFDVHKSTGKSGFTIANNGKVGVGTATPSGPFQVQSADGSTPYLTVTDDGRIGFGTSTVNNFGGIVTKAIFEGTAGQHNGMGFNQPTKEFSSSLVFAKEGAFNWFIQSSNEFIHPAGVPSDRLVFYNSSVAPVMVLQKDGNIGLGTHTVNHAIQHKNGAHLTAAGVWTNASSRDLKSDIANLTSEIAFSTLNGLIPVTYRYKASPEEGYVGFIAEDVPDLVATNDRKGLASMDIVAVLTKVVQEQQATIDSLNSRLKVLENKSE